MTKPFKNARMNYVNDGIVAEAVARVKNKSSYSTLPLFLIPEEFTLPALQAVYEEHLGKVRNNKTFRRQIEDMGVLVPLNRIRPGKGRLPTVTKFVARANW